MKTILVVACVMSALSCSSSNSGKSGPELCAEAGGKCVVGSTQCAVRGEPDCNPSRNPGGFFCCMSCNQDAGAYCD